MAGRGRAADVVTDPSGWHRADPNTPAAQARRRQYDSPEHRAARAKVKKDIAAGTAYCWRCGNWLPPGTQAHVGHSNDRSTILGAECESCNLSAAASKGARVANARRKAREAGLLPSVAPPARKPRPAPKVTPRVDCDLANGHAGLPECGHSQPW